MCMLNSGGIRTPIDEHYKNGKTVFFFKYLKDHLALATAVDSL